MSTSTFYNQIRLFFMVLYHDFYCFISKSLSIYFDYGITYPLLFAFTFGYLQPQLYFGAHNAQMTSLFMSGCLLSVFLSCSYDITIDLMHDLEHLRCVDFILQFLDPRLLIIEKIVWSTAITFLLTAPFFPLCKLFLGDLFITTETNWLALYIIIFLSSLFCSAYHQLVACIVKSNQTVTFWVRINHILVSFGGFWIPWKTMFSFSPLFAYLIHFNPFLYITEGIRASLLGQTNFLPLYQSIIILSFLSLILTFAAIKAFKCRVDYVA